MRGIIRHSQKYFEVLQGFPMMHEGFSHAYKGLDNLKDWHKKNSEAKKAYTNTTQTGLRSRISSVPQYTVANT
jgi:hypothetical protein